MKQFRTEVVNDRFSMADPDLYQLYGIWIKDAEVSAVLNGEKLKAAVTEWEGYSLAERAEIRGSESLSPVRIGIRLPHPLPPAGQLQIYAVKDGSRRLWFKISVGALRKKNRNPQLFVEQLKRENASSVTAVGWVASDSPVAIEAADASGEAVPFRVVRTARPDVQNAFPECEVIPDAGYQLVFEDVKASEIRVIFRSDAGEAQLLIPMQSMKVLLGSAKSDSMKALRYLKKKGPKAFVKRVVSRFKKTDRPLEYSEWIRHNFPKAEELAQQKKTVFSYRPKISVVVPLYKTQDAFLYALVNSVRAQTYDNWELVLSDGSGSPSPIAPKLEKLAEEEPRIRIVPADAQRRIVENTNRGIEAASGDFIAFADHDDVLAPNALFEVAKALNDDPALELIYSDEDKIDVSGKTYLEPQMKPDFNLDLLRTVNYICHLTVMKRELLEKTGLLDPAFEGAQDYDLTLRAIERTEAVGHIPKVLYHWRSHMDSTAENPESKRYAFDAGRRAVQAHFDRLGIAAEVTDGEWPGLYRTRYIRSRDPLISILIPNKDHTDDLDRCITSICEHSTYSNYEFIIIENNSTEEETFAYYKKLEAENPKVRVVYYKGNFNFSSINNFGEKHANGEYLLLLNNDTSMINPDCLEEMLGYCMRPDVGIVGARLYYEDDTVQHAGVVIGFGGIAGHCFVNQARSATGYCHRIICAQDYSAVTAACMMVDRKAFHAVDGLSEKLAVAFNDIDFCLKVREKGYLVVYNPYAELYHYESKSRGYEDTPEKVARFNKEIDTFAKTWPEILEKGDPYYSPNLTLVSQDFSLRKNF